MTNNAKDKSNWNPWHEGERIMQRGLGVADRMAQVGGIVIRDHMPDQHRDFFSQLPFVVFGSVDKQGDVWTGIASGKPGFMASPTPTTLTIAERLNSNDPAHAGLAQGEAIGLLGIELAARRRNRMNGSIIKANDQGLSIEVGHSYGNCPQYIQQRDWSFAREAAASHSNHAEELDLSDPNIRQFIEAADTFFVSSYVDADDGRQIDASHRGGKPGFVRVAQDGLLTIPDFAGNLHFNTLGNFLLNPRAGLIFPDFETGDVLQLTGDAEVILDSPEIGAFRGAERLWTFRPRRAVLRRAALPIRFTFQKEGQNGGWSPNSLMTGDWQQAERSLAAEKLSKQWRPFRIKKTVQESRSIRSFHLEPADGYDAAPFKAGQHLPIQLDIPREDSPIIRTYTLSTAPSDGYYRISVKREDQGLASRHLHDNLREGDVIRARAPAGNFVMDASERRPAVLIAAGVGITPMLSMLRHIVFEGKRTRRTRPSWLFHIAKNSGERAFDNEAIELAEAAPEAIKIVRLASEADPEELPGTAIGRLSAEVLSAVLPLNNYDFYLCGPPGFMQHAYDALISLGVTDGHILAEAFGPASLKRQESETAEETAKIEPADAPVSVSFLASSKEARWEPEGGTLLDLAEQRGLNPEHSCRSGSCGSCAVKLLSGSVAYPNKPSAIIGEGEVLICSAVPAKQDEEDNAPLIIDV